MGSVKLFFSARVTFRLFKVIQGHSFWYQSKARIRLPISPSYSNLGPILHRFGDTLVLQVFCAHDSTPIHPNFGVFQCWGQCEQVP